MHRMNSIRFFSTLRVNITDQVSQPYRTQSEIRVVQILTLTFLHVNWEEKRFWIGQQQACADFSMLLTSS
jgi:hypothetical protein